MLDTVFAQIEGVKKTWLGDVSRRREISRVDPIADTIEYCATELDKTLEQLKKNTEQLTTSQFAALHKTTPQTVTAWCRAKKIRAIPKGPRGWLIPRDAVPPRRRGAKEKSKS